MLPYCDHPLSSSLRESPVLAHPSSPRLCRRHLPDFFLLPSLAFARCFLLLAAKVPIVKGPSALPKGRCSFSESKGELGGFPAPNPWGIAAQDREAGGQFLRNFRKDKMQRFCFPSHISLYFKPCFCLQPTSEFCKAMSIINTNAKLSLYFCQCCGQSQSLLLIEGKLITAKPGGLDLLSLLSFPY